MKRSRSSTSSASNSGINNNNGNTPPNMMMNIKTFNISECLFPQLIIVKLSEEYYIHHDLITICLNVKCSALDSHQAKFPEDIVRILNQTEFTLFVKLISEQVYEKSLLNKRGLHLIENLEEALISNNLDKKLFNLKYLMDQEWFLEFFKSNPTIHDGLDIDPTLFRGIIDLDFSEIIWRSESDHIFERRRKFLKYTVKSENESSTINETLSSTSTVETNTILFPTSSKMMENIHQCVNMFENSQKETTSNCLDISLENIQNLSLSVSSSREMELYEKVCIQGFIIQSLKKLKTICIHREYTPNSDQLEKFKCIAIANIHLSNSSLKLFITSSLEMFFNDDLPNSMFGHLKNFDSLKTVYKEDLLDLISFQKLNEK